jgi:hypothetical protein
MKGFQMSKSVQTVDPQTGEIIVARGTKRAMMKIPKREEITPLDKVAGKNPPAINLRDHPELAGKELVIMDAKFLPSTLGGKLDTYLLMACFVTAPGQDPKEEDFVIIMTGSENVQGRVADAEMAAGEGSPYPLRATLRCSQGGRAWFLD